VRAAITSGAKDEMEDEVGDLLFVVANIARHLKIDPEKAVRRTNGKFIARFKNVEKLAAQSGKDDLTLEELEVFWQSAKKAEKDAR
jgi:ATP diphosphatase